MYIYMSTYIQVCTICTVCLISKHMMYSVSTIHIYTICTLCPQFDVFCINNTASTPQLEFEVHTQNQHQHTIDNMQHPLENMQ